MKNLRSAQLVVESRVENGLTFDLIHAPKQVLKKYGEILKVKLPLKSSLCDSIKLSEKDIEEETLQDLLEKEAKTNTLSFFACIFGESSSIVKELRNIFLPKLASIKVNSLQIIKTFSKKLIPDLKMKFVLK